MGLGISGKDTVQDQVDQTIRECGTDQDVKQVAEQECHTCEYYVDTEQYRSEEEECELDRLCDTGKEGCKSYGEQQGSCLFLLLGSCAGVHSKSSTGKSAHHEGILTCEELRGLVEYLGIGISQHSEEDVLGTLNHFAGDLSGSADTCLPERHIEDVVQTEGDQSTLDAAVDESSEQTCRIDEIAQCIDTGLDRGPDEVADEACYDTEYHTHDRYETSAGEEGQGLGQNLFIELVAGKSRQKACKDTAEHAHLQGLDTKSRSDRAVLDVGAEAAVCQDGSVDGEQYVHSRQHDQIEDR